MADSYSSNFACSKKGFCQIDIETDTDKTKEFEKDGNEGSVVAEEEQIDGEFINSKPQSEITSSLPESRVKETNITFFDSTTQISLDHKNRERVQILSENMEEQSSSNNKKLLNTEEASFERRSEIFEKSEIEAKTSVMDQSIEKCKTQNPLDMNEQRKRSLAQRILNPGEIKEMQYNIKSNISKTIHKAAKNKNELVKLNSAMPFMFEKMNENPARIIKSTLVKALPDLISTKEISQRPPKINEGRVKSNTSKLYFPRKNNKTARKSFLYKNAETTVAEKFSWSDVKPKKSVIKESEKNEAIPSTSKIVYYSVKSLDMMSNSNEHKKLLGNTSEKEKNYKIEREKGLLVTAKLPELKNKARKTISSKNYKRLAIHSPKSDIDLSSSTAEKILSGEKFTQPSVLQNSKISNTLRRSKEEESEKYFRPEVENHSNTSENRVLVCCGDFDVKVEKSIIKKMPEKSYIKKDKTNTKISDQKMKQITTGKPLLAEDDYKKKTFLRGEEQSFSKFVNKSFSTNVNETKQKSARKSFPPRVSVTIPGSSTETFRHSNTEKWKAAEKPNSNLLYQKPCNAIRLSSEAKKQLDAEKFENEVEQRIGSTGSKESKYRKATEKPNSNILYQKPFNAIRLSSETKKQLDSEKSKNEVEQRRASTGLLVKDYKGKNTSRKSIYSASSSKIAIVESLKNEIKPDTPFIKHPPKQTMCKISNVEYSDRLENGKLTTKTKENQPSKRYTMKTSTSSDSDE